MQQARIQSATAHVYRNRWYRRRLWFAWTYPLLGINNLFEGIRDHSRWQFALGLLFFAFIPLAVWSSRSVRLVVTPEGVMYHSGWSLLRVPWQDMECIGRSIRGRYRGWEGIMLREVYWHHPRWLPWPTRWFPQFIPLWSRWYGPSWDQAFFDDLFHYAPWLAGDGMHGNVAQ